MADFNPKDIEVLPGLEPFRRRPLLYIGDPRDSNVSTALLLQSLCHAIDEAIDGSCTTIKLLVQEFGAVVEYDAGLPLHPVKYGKVPAVVILMSEPRGCSNMKKHFEVGAEFCELGIGVLNAVCHSFSVLTHSKGQQAELTFKAGILQEPIVFQESVQPDSTKMDFRLDDAILPEFRFEIPCIRKRAQEMSAQFSINIDVAVG